MKRIVVISLIIAIALFSCGQSDSAMGPSASSGIATSQSSSTSVAESADEALFTGADNFDVSFSKDFAGNVSQSISSDYLLDPLDFSDLPLTSPFPGKKIALVGSNGTKFYDLTKQPKGIDFLKSLKEIGQIPIGTVLPVLGVFKGEANIFAENNPDGFYQYEKEWNYFYLTEYKGKKGAVFGADLLNVAGEDSDPELYQKKAYSETELMRLSYYYTKPTKTSAFVRTIGNYELAPDVEGKLLEDYISFAKAPDYDLNQENPDDLVTLYKDAFTDRERSVFITTDLVVHCLHLIFDRMLSDTEETIFIPALKKLIKLNLAELSKLQGASKGTTEYKVALDSAITYFTVAKALIDMAPYVKHDDWATGGFMYDEIDVDAIIAGVPEKIGEELRLILDAKEPKLSPNFGYEEDYSQYKPRGHYTKNDRLKAYFRAMTFLGKLNFYLDFSTPEAKALTLEHGPTALIINKIYQANPEIAKLWASLFDPITYLIGESDDLNFYDIQKADSGISGMDIEDSIAKRKMAAYLEGLSKKLRAPMIQGNIAYGNADAANTQGSGDISGEPPRGWRLFGQRFVLDSSWTDRLTGAKNEQESRTMAKGLDVAAALLSKSAFAFTQEDRDDPEYGEIYTRNQGLIMSEVTGMRPEDWTKTFYVGYLKLVKEILGFEQGSGFYFTQKPLWDIKTLQTGLASWSELRHDSLLYVKMSASERAGGGFISATFRTIPFERPIHYVEPNLAFFYSLSSLLGRSIPLLKEYHFLTPKFAEKYSDFLSIVSKLTLIVEKEVTDSPIGEDLNEFIVTVPAKLSRDIINYDLASGAWSNDTNQYRMALIADVHTDYDNSQALEVGTGKPFMIYVALNDGQGGKRIAIGFTYSYYEFAQPMSDRLNDDQWKEFIYGNPSHADLEARRPPWLRGFMP